MTNIFAPFGIQDLGRAEGGSPQFGMTKVLISASDATPIFNGDVVQLLPTGSLPTQTGAFGRFITQASSGAVASAAGVQASYVGVFRGCEYVNTAVGRTVWSNWFPGANVSSQADPIAYVDEDMSKLFIAQASTNVTLGSSNVGQRIGLLENGIAMTSTIGNTNSGLSGVALASSSASSTAFSAAGTSSVPFRIVGFYSEYASSGASAFVNGTDNSTSGQILVIRWVPYSLQTFQSSNAI